MCLKIEPKHMLILLLLMLIMLFCRIIPYYHFVFTDWPSDGGNYINIAADDAIYHMRLIYNTVFHFPHRIWFDPFQLVPYGNQVYMGPLFTQIISGTALLIGLGSPSHYLVGQVGAYAPTIMGAIAIFPVYLLTRKIFGKNVALIAAFVFAFLPGEIFGRSSLGFTDHHVAEVLFILIFFTVFIKYLHDYQYQKPTKNSIVTAVFSGITYGLFVLVWEPALMFGAFLLCYFVLQLFVDIVKKQSSEYLVVLFFTTFFVSALLVLPYVISCPMVNFNAVATFINSMILYSPFHVYFLLTLAFGTLILYLIAKFIQKRNYSYQTFPLVLLILVICCLLIAVIAFPTLLKGFFNVLDELLGHPKRSLEVIPESWPILIDRATGRLSLNGLWYNFFWVLPFATCGFLLFIARVIKKRDPAEIAFLAWTLFSLALTISHTRYAYYLAIHMAIFAGYFAYLIFNILDAAALKFQFYKKVHNIVYFLIALIFIALMIYPMCFSLFYANNAPGVRITKDQYDELIWIKKHTPDPQGETIQSNFDFEKGFYEIPKDGLYKFPESAYGIMTWGSNGYLLECISHRIPMANAFNRGNSEENNTIGAAPFFLTTDEDKAQYNLEKNKSRYVFVNSAAVTHEIPKMLAWMDSNEPWQTIKKIPLEINGKKAVIAVPTDIDKFAQTMGYRLYYNDGNGLKHLRLVHESGGDYSMLAKVINFNNGQLLAPFSLHSGDPEKDKKILEKTHNMFWLNPEKTVFAYDVKPPTKDLKLFENVKGVTFVGYAANNAKVTATIKLKTASGRVFEYSQTTVAKSGEFKLTVPYPTEKMQGKNYNYDVLPISKYSVTIGNRTVQVNVTEDMIINGGTIKL
ncbi:MAG: oligosaccharyl transferase, archaeosortase A system-associated [Gammaproteobacteria bacterium]|nr:oligosaccharyl transferase, archaeosortase A system-associated [Gammaproteobacteria bacterium]